MTSPELRIRVCATALLSTTVDCERGGTARVTSHAAVVLDSHGSTELQDSALALPGEIRATLADSGEVVVSRLSDAEYLHVQVFEPGGDEPLLKATGHYIAVRQTARDGHPEIEAR